jgi:hypothetical protein
MSGGMILYGTQNLSQLGRAELAASAGPVAISSKTNISHVRQIKPGHCVAQE